MKRAALYMRVSTLDQDPQTQLYDLRQMAQQRGYQIVEEYTDRISGAKAKRPGFDAMMRDARRDRFDVILVWASDRIARSVKHFLEVLDELNRLNIEFISFREQIDTGGPLGRAVVVIIGAIAELERNLIIERVRAGMRRAKLEGRHIGRKPLALLIEQPSFRIGSEARVSASWPRAILSPKPPSTAFFRPMIGAINLQLAWKPHDSMAAVGSGFCMKVCHTKPVRRFSAIRSPIPRSMPRTSGSYQSWLGWKASQKP